MPRFTSVALLLACGVAFAQEPAKPKYETRRIHDPNGLGKFYLGREIALVMGHQGAGWLERPEREKEEAPTKLHAALALKPGMTVADIGAGTGYHSFRMAEAVGAKGKVLAVDIQQEMLDLMAARKKKDKVTTVELVKGTEKDPKLPAGEVDLILLVDVYHEFEFPYEMGAKMAAALKPGGRLVFVEYRLEDPAVPIKLVHKMTERQVIKEMAAFKDLEHKKTVKTLPWQHVVIFEKKPAEKK
jgi:ubiquinone/menaquinone biosynthesis C-methylase UbiE